MKACQLHQHMQELGRWVNWERTTDGFKFGRPETEVTGIAVGWTSVVSALERAHRSGCNLFVTHEPTFYSHMDDEASWRATEPAARKMEFLERTGMVVYRCHDVWDRMPQIGIADSWGQHLKLGQPLVKRGYYGVYDVAGLLAREVAERVAAAVSDLQQEAVQLLGPADRPVSRLAVGTGAATNIRTMRELGADIALASDDGMRFWQEGTWALDELLPVIVVNHATSESPGMMNLAGYLRRQFPDVKVEYIGPQCLYSVVWGPRLRRPQLAMIRPDLSDLPGLKLPPGYRLDHIGPGQEWAYVEVMAESIYPGCQPDWYRRTFSDDPQYDPANVLLIWRGDRPVAAAAAWQEQMDGEQVGVVHMVGVVRSERGKGLGKAITLAALHRLRQRGFGRAILWTDDWRLPAIGAYLRLGFEPLHRHDSHPARWQAVLAKMKRRPSGAEQG